MKRGTSQRPVPLSDATKRLWAMPSVGGILRARAAQQVTLKKTKAKRRVALQYVFKDLAEFKQRQNNFFLYFNDREVTRRTTNVYKRFLHAYPELTAELTSELSSINHAYSTGSPEWKERMPWTKLFDAYNKMRKLIYTTDRSVIIKMGPNKGKIHKYYLTS